MAFWNRKEQSTETDEGTAVQTVQSAREEPPALMPAAAEPSAPPTVRDKLGSVRSALSKGTTIQGKLSFDTPVRIDGKLQGTIFSSSALIVGESGVIDADLKVQSLYIQGTVKGTVRATERVEVLRGGTLNAVLETPLFSIEEGGAFNGSSAMGTLTDAEKAELEKPRLKMPEEHAAEKEQAAPAPEIRVH